MSETESSACVTGGDMAATPSEQPYLVSFVRSVLRLMPSMSAACVWLPSGALHHRREQRALDVRDHHVVDAVRRLAVQPPEVLVERVLDAAADLVAAVDAQCFSSRGQGLPAL